MLDALPVELKRLQGLSPEECCEGIPSKTASRGSLPKRYCAVSRPEELAAGLSEEQAVRLRELLERKQGI